MKMMPGFWMPRTRGVEDVIRLIMPQLNEWELFYVVVEDLAKRVYRMPVETDQVELLVNLREDEWKRLSRYLRSENLECAGEGDGATPGPIGRDTVCYNFKDKKGETRIKLTGSDDQFDMMTIGRRVLQDFSFSTVFVASVEDLILRELRTGKRANYQEALGMYAYWKNHIDMSYMVRTSKQLDIYNKFIKMKKKGDKRRP